MHEKTLNAGIDTDDDQDFARTCGMSLKHCYRRVSFTAYDSYPALRQHSTTFQNGYSQIARGQIRPPGAVEGRMPGNHAQGAKFEVMLPGIKK